MINPALILIDIQVGLDQYEYYGGNRNNLQAESNCQKLLGFFRENQLHYIFIQHDSTNPESPLYPGKPGHEIKHEVKPKEGDVVIHKSVNSAFIGTNLDEILRKENITNVIIVGLTTEHCISTSARMSANLGFNTTLISDATAAFDKVTPDGVRYDAETVHQVELANLKDEFASVLTTDEILQLLQDPLSQP